MNGLGDMKFYIDIYFNKTPQGMEVVGPPQRWVISANWKAAADNFASDSYHAVMAHASGVALGQVPPDPRFTMYGKQIALQNGHGLGIVGGPPHVKLPEYLNYPEEIVNAAKKNYQQSKWKYLENLTLCQVIYSRIYHS